MLHLSVSSLPLTTTVWMSRRSTCPPDMIIVRIFQATFEVGQEDIVFYGSHEDELDHFQTSHSNIAIVCTPPNYHALCESAQNRSRVNCLSTSGESLTRSTKQSLSQTAVHLLHDLMECFHFTKQYQKHIHPANLKGMRANCIFRAWLHAVTEMLIQPYGVC